MRTLKQQQTNHIIMITFWSQFASYALNSILILFLTRPTLANGLNYSQATAYTFLGISQATGYLMPIIGGYMADHVLGIRRSILMGSILLVLSYLFIMLSGYSISYVGDRFFIAAYALTPAANSLLIGTATSMIARVHGEHAVATKTAMTYYYLAINCGALLGTLIAPSLLDSALGPLSVLALAFFGKSIAAINFAYHYHVYDNVVSTHDQSRLSYAMVIKTLLYLTCLYLFTLMAYSHPGTASWIVLQGCMAGIAWFVFNTCQLPRLARNQQAAACLLIIEAIVFFVIYNQMNSTLIMFAEHYSDHRFLGFSIRAAHYQLLNPLLILALGLQLPRLYKKFPSFSIPYQFATGTLLASSALFIISAAPCQPHQDIISGNYIAMTYVFISLAELCVSAIGLSMIGLYCDRHQIGFAMGTWFLASSLSNIISARIASWSSISNLPQTTAEGLFTYQSYYSQLGTMSAVLSLFMFLIALKLRKISQKTDLSIV